jgi:hypothetical protein
MQTKLEKLICTTKETIKVMKRNPIEWEKIHLIGD